MEEKNSQIVLDEVSYSGMECSPFIDTHSMGGSGGGGFNWWVTTF